MTIIFKDWVSDWRGCVKELEAAGGETPTSSAIRRSLSIMSTWQRAEYKVLTVLLFEPQLDGGRKLAQITSRDFDNKVNLYSHRTRDTGLARVITNKGRPLYLVEQGPEALDWAAAVEGMPVSHLVAATLEGSTGLGRVPRILQGPDPLVGLKALAQTIKVKQFELEQESNALTQEQRLVEFELERLQ